LNNDRIIKVTKYGKKVIIVICGGDGSFMNLVQEFKEDGIDIDKLIFTQFPFGTANDVPNAFGWGRTPPKQMLTNLFRVCKELIEAKEIEFDIWEINITVKDKIGDILIPGGKLARSLCTTKITKIMCHSFSFGVDARIGLAFELKRTRNRH
jgi:diacylglycerol kinase family enzyme